MTLFPSNSFPARLPACPTARLPASQSIKLICLCAHTPTRHLSLHIAADSFSHRSGHTHPSGHRTTGTTNKMILSTLLLVLVILVNQTEQSIFSSLIRNNLNRYLKNPLFTK